MSMGIMEDEDPSSVPMKTVKVSNIEAIIHNFVHCMTYFQDEIRKEVVEKGGRSQIIDIWAKTCGGLDRAYTEKVIQEAAKAYNKPPIEIYP